MRWRNVPGITDKKDRTLSYNLRSIKKNNRLKENVTGIRSFQYESGAQEKKTDWASNIEDYQVTY